MNTPIPIGRIVSVVILLAALIASAGSAMPVSPEPPVSIYLTYSGTAFHERGRNDGGIDNSSPVTITLTGDTFDSMNGTNLVSAGLATVTNLPAGLTAVITVTSSTQLSMTITGTATSHAAANNVSNLSVEFGDGTFSVSSPASVTGYSRSDLSITFFDPFDPNALKFDGVDDEISITTPSPTAYTIECWVKLTSTSDQIVFQRTDGSGVNYSFSHELNVAGGVFQHYVYDGGGPTVTGTTTLQTGTWYHVAVTATNGGTIKLYVNGALEGTPVALGSMWSGGTRYAVGPARSGFAFFSGTLDEFRIWNSERSQSVIQSTMNNSLTVTEDGLIAYYNFDQGSGTTLYDVSNGGHNASLSNFAMTGSASNYVSSVTALPVELASFSAVRRGTAVTLRWSTATETNNHGFTVERKQGETWSALTFIHGQGTTNTRSEYSYTDASAPATAQYRLKQTDRDGTVHYSSIVEATSSAVPSELFLGQNYPNPFNPSTTISFSVPVTGHASLKIYDAVGREVAVLFNGIVDAGTVHTEVFDASRHSSGIYFARLMSGGRARMTKMTLLK